MIGMNLRDFAAAGNGVVEGQRPLSAIVQGDKNPRLFSGKNAYNSDGGSGIGGRDKSGATPLRTPPKQMQV